MKKLTLVLMFGISQIVGLAQTDDELRKAFRDHITKVFTGILLAEAIKLSDVKLEDPISKHLPPRGSENTGVSVRNLRTIII